MSVHVARVRKQLRKELKAALVSTFVNLVVIPSQLPMSRGRRTSGLNTLTAYHSESLAMNKVCLVNKCFFVQEQSLVACPATLC